jgi:(heptosyl)LPS beta-1,4-glucosyltransferase
MFKARLTIALITKNEVENLEACLQSVAWADEIVIVDSGSTDGTLDVARNFTDKVFVEADWPGFGRQRQRAQAKASGDWILALDADERVTPELKGEILQVLEKDDRNNVYAMPRLSWAFGAFIRHSGWYPGYVFRLYPKSRAQFDDALVHEKLEIDDGLMCKYLTADLLHYTFRGLENWVTKTARYAKDWADQREQAGKRVGFSAGFGHAAAYFFKAYIIRLGFMDGRAGLLLAILGAYSRFLKYTDLWLRSVPSKPERD